MGGGQSDVMLGVQSSLLNDRNFFTPRSIKSESATLDVVCVGPLKIPKLKFPLWFFVCFWKMMRNVFEGAGKRGWGG